MVADLDPHGAMELALAEQVAVKLWRLGRVVRYEADLIANAQDEDELLHAHEKAHHRCGSFEGPGRTDIPTREDVRNARKAAEKAREKVKTLTAALCQIKRLPGMKDEDALPDWTLCELIEEELGIPEKVMVAVFKNEDEDGPLLARSVRAMLAFDGEGQADVVTNAWRDQKATAEKEAGEAEWKAKGLAHRYKAALDRRRRERGLPGQEDLDRIQRYEAHLERGLHKALDRLRDLQATRGAVPPRGPSVAVAVVQAGPEKALADQMGPFGSFALEAVDEAQEPAEVDASGCHNR